MRHTVRHIVRGMRSRDLQVQPGRAASGAADLQLMRTLNRLLVLNCVRERGPVARAAVARQTGLSRTTVSSIMDALLKDGLVFEGSTQSATPSGGRRAILVHFNAAAGYVVGVDLGRTHLILLLSDLAANPKARRAGPFDVDRGPDVCLPWLVRELRAFLEEQRVAWNQVVGVGMSIPAPLDASLHILVSPPRMPGWDGVDVRRILARELGVPIYLDNDANMGALGESRYGAGRGITELAYVKIGTGIGGCLVTGGRIFRGSRGSAGEIGHVTIDENGPVCGCGNRGCLEAVAGAQAIVNDARQAISLRRKGEAESSRALQALAAPDVADVVQAALDGDSACTAAIERGGEHIGVALAGLVNLTNPSLILVDGGVARAGDVLLDPIRRAVVARSLPIASAHVRIKAGALGDNAIALGATAAVIDAAFGATYPLAFAEEAQEPGAPAGPNELHDPNAPAVAGQGSERGAAHDPLVREVV
jgi:glucokinase-like ROK family protein